MSRSRGVSERDTLQTLTWNSGEALAGFVRMKREWNEWRAPEIRLHPELLQMDRGPLVEFVMTLKTNLQIFSINKGEEEAFLCIDLTTLARCSPRKGKEEPWV